MTDKTELELLKEKADAQGIKYSPNIGLAALKEKLGLDQPVLTAAARRQKLIKEATKLIRVTVTCVNPSKKEARGEYFTFGNSAVGSITRFVPFDTETHVENALLEQMKERKFAKVTMRKGQNGAPPYPDRTLVREFGIVELDPLTKEELADLAADQAKRGAIDK